jgi:hypothetical protein
MAMPPDFFLEGGTSVKFYSLLSHGAWNRSVALVIVLALVTVTTVGPAWSQDSQPVAPPVASDSEGGNASSAGMQAAAFFSSILYAPFKLAFAIGGGIVGGLAYAFSGGNEQAAKSIWHTSMYGTYLITPEHLRGDRPVRFLGVADQTDEPAISQPSPAPTPAPEPVR